VQTGGIRYTKRDTVVDIGPVKATAEHHETIPISPIVGIAAVAGGIALVVAGSRTRVSRHTSQRDARGISGHAGFIASAGLAACTRRVVARRAR